MELATSSTATTYSNEHHGHVSAMRAFFPTEHADIEAYDVIFILPGYLKTIPEEQYAAINDTPFPTVVSERS